VTGTSSLCHFFVKPDPMRNLPLILLLAATLSGTARADPAPLPEVWRCHGAYQTDPGNPVSPQNRTLTLIIGSDKATMKVDSADYQGRFEASGQHVMAWFEVTGAGGEPMLEEATLGRVSGRLATSVQREDGSRAGIFRGGCSLEEVPAQKS